MTTPLPKINSLEEAAVLIQAQHVQIAWLTSAVQQLQGIFGVQAPTMPGQRQINSDPNRTEVGMGPILSSDKSSFV